MNDFKIGDKVKFDSGNDSVGEYYADYDDIPSRLIIHGSTKVHEDYYKEHATIVDTHNQYLIVKYKGGEGQYVQLGFSPDTLLPVFTTWRDRYKESNAK